MKPIEEATNDIATFMYGVQWWKNETLKKEIFIDKKFEKFENLKPVWKKMADKSSDSKSFLPTEKTVSDIFQDVVSDMYMHSYGHETIEQQLLVTTSESLKTINK